MADHIRYVDAGASYHAVGVVGQRAAQVRARLAPTGELTLYLEAVCGMSRVAH